MSGRTEGGATERRLCGLAFFLATLVVLLLATPASAAKIDDQFHAWLQGDLWPEANAKGISRKTFDAAFDGVKPNLKLPDLVMPGKKATTPQKQHQAEFGSPGAYFAEKTVRAVTSGGRSRAAANARTIAAIEKRYGVPGEVLLAIWGRETGFGAAKMPYDAFEVLGTKAFMATRKDFFRTELLAALEIVERGLAPVSAMKSSWAGALGQPQFMPSSFLNHAVDFDGDGRADIWNSVPDTLASIANYLVHYGWVKGRGWGFEVTVPETVSCSLEGPDQGKRISEWADMGIKRVAAKPFPARELKAEGFLLMPAGRSGPAFIVTPNFYVLKQYNTSDLYALFIGHGADRIAHGDSNFSGSWGAVGGLHRSDIATLQRALEAEGYNVGSADGLPGFKTRRSIGKWQAGNGRAATCFPDADLVTALK
ncbi:MULTISPECIES: lytic murein transglycosylase [unclassified Mesorhizobium]|uniref:lytic murein transglycosylase n=1 Tax=unclassified Mesorhizobium TaxID=325217 RepID=UPI000FD2688A|nr:MULTISPECIES: lytic murein transglycosylase [unclassified Mesorhizobium]RVB74129.1 lytic murein transglycosylase [Mesorhizobium sp. M6A.T.Cr.TU.014.01.1.1]RWQ01805.1 MAG: lytic murein transglycosylase [Mesorhizobium sp.]RWQ02417.1 MAG: lytic murein transglycosylase [Mesorhizobium sp.]